MLKPSLLILSCLTLSSYTFAHQSCSDLTSCERAICKKEIELQEARQYKDYDKIIGIQNSLVHMKENCALNPQTTMVDYQQDKAELMDEHQEDVEDALNEFNDDLQEAQADGKEAKIRRAREKYDSKMAAIEAEFERKLSELKNKYGIVD